MDDAVQQALELDRVIDITTTGRNTGQPLGRSGVAALLKV